MSEYHPVDLEHIRKMAWALPLADNETGVPQTQAAMYQMAAEIAALREAVRVLGEECRWWNYHHSDHDEICAAKQERLANPIARAAVEGAKPS